MKFAIRKAGTDLWLRSTIKRFVWGVQDSAKLFDDVGSAAAYAERAGLDAHEINVERVV